MIEYALDDSNDYVIELAPPQPLHFFLSASGDPHMHFRFPAE